MISLNSLSNYKTNLFKFYTIVFHLAARCNWLDLWCWPGTCYTANEYLAETCKCQDGFEIQTPNDEITKCKCK